MPGAHDLLLSRIHATRLRLRAQRALDGAAAAAAVALAVASAVTMHGRLHGAVPYAAEVYVASLAIPLIAGVAAALRATSGLGAALRLDRSHRHDDLIASAWSFLAAPSTALTPFARATVERAAEVAERLSPARAAALHVPALAKAVPLLAAGLLVALLWPERHPPAPAAARPAPSLPRLLADDDLRAARAAVRGSAPAAAANPRLASAQRELEVLIEELAGRRVGLGAALARLRDLEGQLSDAAPRAPRPDPKGPPPARKLDQLSRDLDEPPPQPGRRGGAHEQEQRAREELTAQASQLRELLRREGAAQARAHATPKPAQAQSLSLERFAAEAGAAGRPARGAAQQRATTGETTRVAGVHGRGPSRSEVIYDAAERGFASPEYTSVHADYARHAQRELEREVIPAGYRFYVKRYFQLIRPREDAHD